MSTRNSAVIVSVLLLVLADAQNRIFGQNTSSGPAGNLVRYEHQESPHGRWQLDYYEDPSGFGREVWISENRPGAPRRKLFAHYIPIKPPVVFSPDESLAAINHGSLAWGTEPAFARVGAKIRLVEMEDGAFQQLAVGAIRKAGGLPQGAEPAHVYCDALNCPDSENIELRILLDCQPSPTTRWIGPFFYRYNLQQSVFSPSAEPTSEQAAVELPQMAFESLKSFGTGFFISPKGYVLTNEHVIHGATRVSIGTKSGLLPAKLAAVSPSRDLAILKVVDRAADAAKFPALQLSIHPDVSLGQNVFTIGFPNPDIQGLNPKFTSGQINASTGINDDPRMYQISIAIQPGNSGGALADEHGRAIGIVSGALNAIAVAKHTGSIPQNVNYAIKAEAALSLINDIPELKEAATTAENSAATYEEAIKQVEAATVRVVVSGFPAPPAGATNLPVAPPRAERVEQGAATAKFARYTNAAYRFSALVPTNVFVRNEAPSSNDRALYVSRDSRTRLLLLARHNSPDRTLAKIYSEWTAEHTKTDPGKVVQYKVLRDHWFVVSGQNSSRGFYVKVVLRGDVLLLMCLEYEEGDCPLSAKDIAVMSDAFTGN